MLFQKILSPPRRSPPNVRTTGLLFCLFLVVAAFMTLRWSGAPGRTAGAGTPSPSPSSAPRRVDTGSRQGGVDVILMAPRPRSSK